MMSRADKYTVLVIFLMLAINVRLTALAEEIVSEEIIARPVVEYTSSKSRDPFKSYIKKEESRQVLQEGEVDSAKPALDLSKVTVQGVIWGVQFPQAIIDNVVLGVGDEVQGAKIIKIEKKGIILSFNGEIFDLAAPGVSSVQAPINQGGIK